MKKQATVSSYPWKPQSVLDVWSPRTKLDLAITVGAIADAAVAGRIAPKVAVEEIRKLCYAWMHRWIARDKKRNPGNPLKRRRRAAGRR